MFCAWHCLVFFLLGMHQMIPIPIAASEFLFWLPCVSLVNFLQCTCHGRLSEQFSLSHVAFWTAVVVTGGYRKAVTSFLKRVTEEFSQISKWKTAKNCKKHKNSCKNAFLYSGPSKKYSSHDAIPLRGKVDGQQAKVGRLRTSKYIREKKNTNSDISYLYVTECSPTECS